MTTGWHCLPCLQTRSIPLPTYQGNGKDKLPAAVCRTFCSASPFPRVPPARWWYVVFSRLPLLSIKIGSLYTQDFRHRTYHKPSSAEFTTRSLFVRHPIPSLFAKLSSYCPKNCVCFSREVRCGKTREDKKKPLSSNDKRAQNVVEGSVTLHSSSSYSVCLGPHMCLRLMPYAREKRGYGWTVKMRENWYPTRSLLISVYCD